MNPALTDLTPHLDRLDTRAWCIDRITNGNAKVYTRTDVYNALCRSVERQAAAEGIDVVLPAMS